MELDQFVQQATAEGVTPEAVKALAQKLIDHTTGNILSSIDNSIQTVTGQKRPDGTKTHDFVASIAKGFAESTTAKTAYEKKIQELSAANPNIDSLKKEYESKIASKDIAIRQQEITRMLEKATFSLPIGDAYKDTFGDILDVKISKILPMVAEKNGELIIVDSDGTPKLDNKGKAILAKAHLLEQLAPFAAATAPQGAPPPRGATGVANMQTLTTDQKFELAKKHNINIRTAEGQAQMEKLLGEAK